MRTLLTTLGWLALALTLAAADPATEPKKADPGTEERARMRARIQQLERENEALRKKADVAQIEARTLAERLRLLEQRLADLVKEIARMKAGAPAKAAVEPANPLPAGLTGTIVRVDDKGLAVLSLGSDAGLKQGDTLEVYRLGAAPKYLGQIRIIAVEAKQSVGKPVGRPLAPWEKGDRVSSRIPAR